MKQIPLFFLALMFIGSICSCRHYASINTPPCDTCDKPRPTLAQLQATRIVSVEFTGKQNNGNPDFFMQFFRKLPNWYFINRLSDDSLVWTDHSFISNSVNGSLSSSRMDIDSFKCSKGEGKQPTPPDMGYIAYTQQLEGSLIAFSAIHGDTLIYSLSGPIVKDHLTKIYLYGSMNTKYLGSGSTGYSGTDWNNTITPPQIIIKFYK